MQAQTVIWIARDFDESHLSAIRWLNDHTEAPFAFFAVRVRVVQIADSPRVPLFEVLERPSTWDRSVRTTVTDGELTRFRREFWTFYAERHPSDSVAAGYAASSFWIWIESAELNLSPYLAQGAVGVGLRGRRSEPKTAVRERIQRWEGGLRDRLGVEIGEGTTWGSFAHSRRDFDTNDRSNWSDMADWLHDKIGDYRRVLETLPGRPRSNLSAQRAPRDSQHADLQSRPRDRDPTA